MASLDFLAVPDRVKGALGGARAPRIAEGLLAIGLGALIALGFVKLLAPLPTPQGDPLAAATPLNHAQQREPLVVKSPFPKTETVAAPETAPEVEETALDLTLTGVWPGDDRASAIIRKPDGKQDTFAIGDTIVSGVTLAAVYTDQVIIQQNGVRESLRFESKPRVPSRVSAQNAQQPAPSQGPANPISNASLQSLFQIRPVQADDGGIEIAIFAGSDAGKFRQTGLHDGDILRSINGAPPPMDPQALTQLFNQLERSGEAVLVVERENESQTISVSLNELGIR
ncbi:type II secretion system protein N [Hyphococcus sp.]|uniref:type II secretion system protein N n=1 Tax=Hyphococcus sp. TaxID=2038636 RepID=UPI003CCBF070